MRSETLLRDEEVAVQEQKLTQIEQNLVKLYSIKQAQLSKAKDVLSELKEKISRYQPKQCFEDYTFQLPFNYKYGVSTVTGHRPTNEDAHIASNKVLAVFDGHGGPLCSKEASTLLVKQLQKNHTNNFETDIKLNLLDLDSELLFDDEGCTAALCVFYESKFYFANIGDARVLTPKYATNDHKPALEVERIQSYGGTVLNGRVAGELAVSRALGDRSFKAAGVVALADVIEAEEESWILVACDGLFDVLSNDEVREAINCILKKKKPQNQKSQLIFDFYEQKKSPLQMDKPDGEYERMSQALVKAAYELGSEDNISVIFCQKV